MPPRKCEGNVKIAQKWMVLRYFLEPFCLKWTVGDDSEGLISNMGGHSITSTKNIENLLLNQIEWSKSKFKIKIFFHFEKFWKILIKLRWLWIKRVTSLCPSHVTQSDGLTRERYMKLDGMIMSESR